MVRWSDTGENVLRQLHIILFFPTLLRHFQLKKSDFLGIFKNVLREFHCIPHSHYSF